MELPSGIPNGYIEIKAYTNGVFVVVPEQKGMELSGDDDRHNCDALGCGWEHVVLILQIPAAKQEREADATGKS